MKGRPVIEGSALHKASIAKAKGASIVAPAEQGADAVLVNRGRDLGLSNVSQAIDFSKEKRELDIKRKKKKKDEDPVEDLTAKEKEVNMSKKETITSELPKASFKNYTKEELKRLEKDGVFSEKHGRVVLPEELNVKPTATTTPKVKSDMGPKDGDVSKSGNIWDGKGGRWVDPIIYKEIQKESSAVKMRSDKIWSGAVEGGEVRRKMRKGGYIPQNEI